MIKNKLYGEEGTFRSFTLVNAGDGRFCRFEATNDPEQVSICFRDYSGTVRKEVVDTQEAINQICVMLLNNFVESYDSDTGGPTRDLIELAEDMSPTSPSLYLN